MVDKTLIFRKLSMLEQYLLEIAEYSGIRTRDYSENWKTQRIIERTLQMMIEICLDIASHIISDKKFRVPDSYADMFIILHENNLVEKPLLDALIKMAKFRNVIVHHYDKVDPAIVVGILHNNLDDFSRYKDAVVFFLKGHETEK